MTSHLSNVWKVVHFSYIFHIKLDIHKITFQAIFSIIFYKNSYTYAKNIEKLENGVNFLKNWVEVLVFDPRYDVTYPTLKQLWLMGISPDAHAQKRLKYAPRVILGWGTQIWTQFSDISNISPQAWRHHYQIGSKGAQSYISWNKKAVSMKICIHSNFRVGNSNMNSIFWYFKYFTPGMTSSLPNRVKRGPILYLLKCPIQTKDWRMICKYLCSFFDNCIHEYHLLCKLLMLTLHGYLHFSSIKSKFEPIFAKIWLDDVIILGTRISFG